MSLFAATYLVDGAEQFPGRTGLTGAAAGPCANTGAMKMQQIRRAQAKNRAPLDAAMVSEAIELLLAGWFRAKLFG